MSTYYRWSKLLNQISRIVKRHNQIHHASASNCSMILGNHFRGTEKVQVKMIRTKTDFVLPVDEPDDAEQYYAKIASSLGAIVVDRLDASFGTILQLKIKNRTIKLVDDFSYGLTFYFSIKDGWSQSEATMTGRTILSVHSRIGR